MTFFFRKKFSFPAERPAFAGRSPFFKWPLFLMLALLLSPFCLQAQDLDGDLDGDLDFSDLLGSQSQMIPSPQPESTSPGNWIFEGEIRPSVWYPMKSPHDLKTTNRMDLFVEKQHRNTTFAVRARADYQNINDDEGTEADIRELYLTQRWQAGRTHVSLSAGRKILYWGKGDEIRPMDRINPEDMTSFLYYDKNDRKTGIPGLFLNTVMPQGLRVEAFWSPVFVGSSLPEPDSYFSPSRMEAFRKAGGLIRNADEDWQWEADASLGLRVAFPLRHADLSLYAWKGKDPMPTLKVSRVIREIPLPTPPYVMDIPPTPTELSYFHSNALVFGTDLELTAGSFVFRAEGAWQAEGHHERVNFEKNPSLLNRFTNGLAEKQKGEFLIGMDRNDLFVRNLFVNVQYMAVLIHDHEEALEADAFTQGFSFTLKYSLLDSRISGMWRVFTWLNSQDRQHQIELSWKPARNTLFTLGAFFYDGGTEKDLFGQFREKDFSFLRVGVLF
jgi:hypothetical protein